MAGRNMVSQRVRDAAVCEIKDDQSGLSEEEALESRRNYGRNTISEKSPISFLKCLGRAFINPFSVILFFLALISFLTEILSKDSASLRSVIIILTMLLISGGIRLVQELRGKRVAEELTHLVHTTVTVKRNGKWQEASSEEIVVGDLVRLEAGDRVPADIRLTSAENLFVSQSVITGESAILEKNAGVVSTSPSGISDYCNTVFMGTTVTGGAGLGIVQAVGRDTVYGSFDPSSSERKKGFDRGANAIAWVLIRFMAVLVPVVFLAAGLTHGDWLSAFLFALSVAVGLTPEMLPMVVSACLAKGGTGMRNKQTIVKDINAMQSFGSMDILCVDKTGTLTGDTILLEYYMDILGNESKTVLQYAYLNSLHHSGVKNHLDTAILRCRELPFMKETADRCRKLDELPFDYDRKLASVLLQTDEGRILLVKGSVDDVCARCEAAEYKGSRTPMGLSSVHAVTDEMTEDGMKLLAVAYKPMDADTLSPGDEQGLILLGYLAFFDAPKKSAAGAVEMLQRQNVGVRVLTGDQKNVALSVCKRLRIAAAEILTGSELEQLSEEQLPIAVEKTTVFAELSPKQKAGIVRILKENGHTVGFLGDGINDLPAIVEADVGISVDTACEAVKDCADVILLKKDLCVLEQATVEGRKAFSNMSKYIRITASSNFGNILSVVIAGVLLPFFPMASVQLLLLNLLYDTLCLVLPWDNVDAEDIARPSEWSGKTLGRFMGVFGPISSIFDLVTYAALFFLICPMLCGGSFNTLSPEGQNFFVAAFQTGWFLESLWTQVLILHLLRTRKLPLLQSRPSAPVMLVTVLGICLFTVLTYTPVGAAIGMVPMPPIYYGFLIAIVGSYMLLVSFAKQRYIRKYQELI